MQGKTFRIYFNQNDYERFQRILEEERTNGFKGSASELIRKRFFHRRERKTNNNPAYFIDMILLGKLQSIINAAIGDYLNKKDIILTLRELESLVNNQITSHEDHP